MSKLIGCCGSKALQEKESLGHVRLVGCSRVLQLTEHGVIRGSLHTCMSQFTRAQCRCMDRIYQRGLEMRENTSDRREQSIFKLES